MRGSRCGWSSGTEAASLWGKVERRPRVPSCAMSSCSSVVMYCWGLVWPNSRRGGPAAAAAAAAPGCCSREGRVTQLAGDRLLAVVARRAPRVKVRQVHAAAATASTAPAFVAAGPLGRHAASPALLPPPRRRESWWEGRTGRRKWPWRRERRQTSALRWWIVRRPGLRGLERQPRRHPRPAHAPGAHGHLISRLRVDGGALRGVVQVGCLARSNMSGIGAPRARARARSSTPGGHGRATRLRKLRLNVGVIGECCRPEVPVNRMGRREKALGQDLLHKGDSRWRHRIAIFAIRGIAG